MLKYNLFIQIYFIYARTIISFETELMKYMNVNILLFGITKDLVGKQKLQMELPKGTTVSDFKKDLGEKYPELIELDSMAIAVNSEYARDADVLQSDDEIALIPPVSGG
jgi:molybdopterin synthase sulfur carrier subunit